MSIVFEQYNRANLSEANLIASSILSQSQIEYMNKESRKSNFSLVIAKEGEELKGFVFGSSRRSPEGKYLYIQFIKVKDKRHKLGSKLLKEFLVTHKDTVGSDIEEYIKGNFAQDSKEFWKKMGFVGGEIKIKDLELNLNKRLPNQAILSCTEFNQVKAPYFGA